MVTWVFTLLLSVMSQELRSSHTADYAFSDMSLVVRAVVATPCILLFADEHDVIVAVRIPIIAAVTTTILAFLVTGFVETAAVVHLFDSALVIVVFIVLVSTGLTARNRSLFDHFGPVNNLVSRLLTTHNDLLAHGFLEDNGLGSLLADNDGHRRRRSGGFRTVVLCGSGVLLQLRIAIFPEWF
jgi:uncharacterized membrane protein